MSLFAITEVHDSSPASHLVSAGLFYVLGIALIITRIVRGEVTDKRGSRESTPKLIIITLIFFTWGTLSLASGLGHGLSASYDLGIRLGTLGLGLICSVYHNHGA